MAASPCVALMSFGTLLLNSSDLLETVTEQRRQPCALDGGISARSLNHNVIRKLGVEFSPADKAVGEGKFVSWPPEIVQSAGSEKKYLTNTVSRAYINERFDT
jgi:hypothetical protein